MKFDSLIFDMDGTLWDAVDSYSEIWNQVIDELHTPVAHVTRAQLEPLMGKTLDTIYATLVGDAADKSVFFELLTSRESELMPVIGGKVYPGVHETLRTLKNNGVKLFMISNCGAHGLPNFLTFTGLGDVMTDHLSLGQTGKSKTENILNLIKRYNLERPAYVGDTAGDRDYTHAASIPFIWAAYGFGHDVYGADYTINNIKELMEIQ